MMQNGGPSQMDLFDPKPELERTTANRTRSRSRCFSTGARKTRSCGARSGSARSGPCGMELSEVIPHIGSVADDLCLVRSMYTEHNNHTEGADHVQTGKIFQGRPALGSWISYALGTENQNLPAYIVLRDPAGYNTSGTLIWSRLAAGALSRDRIQLAPAPRCSTCSRPTHSRPASQSDNLRFLGAAQRMHHRNIIRDESELETRIQNYELAARMQLAAGDVLDLSDESAATRKLYGLDNPTTAGYGLRCLMARRLVEAGVRFVQIFPPSSRFQPWDTHANLKTGLRKICGNTDQPTAGLITRPQAARACWTSTIVHLVGRVRPAAGLAERQRPRPQPQRAFSLLLAGGGFKAGYVHGATDEVGYKAVVDPRQRARPARHDPAPARPRPRIADLPPLRPRRNAHRLGAHQRLRRRRYPHGVTFVGQAPPAENGRAKRFEPQCWQADSVRNLCHRFCPTSTSNFRQAQRALRSNRGRLTRWAQRGRLRQVQEQADLFRGNVLEGKRDDFEVGAPDEDDGESAAMQHCGERFFGEAGLVSEEILAAAFDFDAEAVKHVAHCDWTGRRLIEQVVDIEAALHDGLHQLPQVRYADLRKALGLQDVEETGEYLGNVVAVIVLEIV